MEGKRDHNRNRLTTKRPARSRRDDNDRQVYPGICEDPIKNYLVVSCVFEACDVETLKSCRLVCKEWRNVSLDAWRRKAVLGITEVEDLATNNATKAILLKDLLQILKRSRNDNEGNRGFAGWKLVNKPFRNYRFIGVAFRDEGRCHGYQLLEYIGQSTKYLSLMGCGFKGNTLRTRFFSLIPNLTKLKLILNFSIDVEDLILGPAPRGNQQARFPDPDDIQEHHVLRKLKHLELVYPANHEKEVFWFMAWKQLLVHMPNLEKVSIRFYEIHHPHNDPDVVYRKFSKLLDAIGEIREVDETKIQLKELDILNMSSRGISSFPSTVIVKLNSLQLKLTKLSLDVGCTTRGSEVSKLLEPCSKTLEKLTLFQLVGSGPLLEFPFGLQMGSLRVLHLHGNLVEDFGFLQWTPNLESLHVFYDSRIFYIEKHAENRNMSEGIRKTPRMKQDVVAKTLDKFSMKTVRLEKLEDLQGDFKVSTRKTFKILTEWMPNVRTLYLPVSKLTFPVICENWSQSLRVWKIPKWCDLEDETITGIKCSQGVSNGKRERLPNITDVKGLTSFSILCGGVKTECEHTMTNLTDHSILEGFLQLPDLQTLCIYTCRPVRRENLKALEEKVETVVICEAIDRCPCGSNVLVKPRSESKDKLMGKRQEVDRQCYVAAFEIESAQKKRREARERRESAAGFEQTMEVLVGDFINFLQQQNR